MKILSKRIIRFISIFFCLGLVTVCTAQKVSLQSGDFIFLQKGTGVAIHFDYDSMRVDKFENEELFISHRKSKFEEKKKGAGRRWEDDWRGKRKIYCENRFRNNFFKYSKLDSLQQSKYTLVVKVRKLISGFENDDLTHYVYLSLHFHLIRNDQPERILASAKINNVKGEAVIADFTGSVRIGDAFAIAARSLGDFITDTR